MISIFRRNFSSIVRELGSKLEIESLKLRKDSVNFFKLEKLANFDEALEAKEGSVVVVDPFGPTQYEKSKSLF